MHDWGRHLSRAGLDGLDAIRRDMDKGQLANEHLSDVELAVAIRRMQKISRRLPRDPGVAAHLLLKAMKL